MATRTAHKNPHKFKHKKVVKKKHKVIRKRKIAVRIQSETEKQESVVSAQQPVADSVFPKPLASTSQENTTVEPQPQQVHVEPETQPTEAKPITASPIPSENPPGENSKEAPAQPVASQQASDIGPSVSEQKPVSQSPSVSVSNNGDGNASFADLEPKHKKSGLWIILVFLIILAIVAGALYYFREEFILKPINEEKKAQEPTPTVSETSPTQGLEEKTATESADVEVDSTEYSITVLNGSGIAGEAAKARDILEKANFIVDDIGNADAATYGKTVIKAKENVSKDFLDLLRKELGQTYLLDSNQTLEESEDADVVVIIGREEV